MPSSSTDSTGSNEAIRAGFADKTPYLINGEFVINAGFSLKPGVTMEMNRDAVIRGQHRWLPKRQKHGYGWKSYW